MTLNDLKSGEKGVITFISLDEKTTQRLTDMGVTSGVEVKVLRRAPLGDAIEILVRGYRLSIRKNTAVKIQINK